MHWSKRAIVVLIAVCFVPELVCHNEINRHRRAVIKKYHQRPEKLISFTFDSTIPQHHDLRKCVIKAQEHISSSSCVKFVENTYTKATQASWRLQTKKKGYILYKNSTNPDICSAVAGLKSAGPTTVNLGLNCGTSVEVCVRETLHALGFVYEHNRQDREKYVQIFMDRIRKFHEYNYVKDVTRHDYDYMTPYDMSSVMHFRPNDYSNQPGEKTMSAKYAMMEHSIGGQLRARQPMSHRDKLAVNELFGCAATCTNELSCEHGGYMNEKCECVCPYAFTGKVCEKLVYRKHFDSPKCGVRKIRSSGFVTSVGYPNGYKSGSFCQWLLETDNVWERIEFKIATLDLQHENTQSMTRCDDTLQIWPHGTDVATHPLSCQPEDVRDYQKHTYMTQHNWLLIELRTSSLILKNHTGFKITYRVIDDRPRQDTAVSSAQTSDKPSFDHLKNKEMQCYSCNGRETCAQGPTNFTLKTCKKGQACASSTTPIGDSQTRTTTYRGCMDIAQCNGFPAVCPTNRTCTQCCDKHKCNAAIASLMQNRKIALFASIASLIVTVWVVIGR